MSSETRRAAMETYWREVQSIEEEKEGEEGEEEEEEERKSMDGKTKQQRELSPLRQLLPVFVSCRDGGGGGVADRGGAILPGHGFVGGRGGGPAHD